MTTVLDALAIVALAIGTLFSLIGVLGLLRLPDAYARLHATGKVSVFGVSILLAGAMLTGATHLGKAASLVLFLVVAGPVLAHALAASAGQAGVPMRSGQGRDPDQRDARG
jgi:multicomponent Na+:H+ antiporter subunit G